MRTGLICCLAVWFAVGPAAARADNVIDSPMYLDPDLPAPPIEYLLPEKVPALWLAALERPEEDYRARAAEAIARAHQIGAKGLGDVVGPLVAALERPEQPGSVRVAVARALVVLDARAAAPALFRASRAGPREMRELIDPTLARWDHRPAREPWLQQLRDPTASVRTRLAAAQSLGVVREDAAVAPLREVVLLSRAAASLRLEAARALAVLRTEGLEPDAEKLIADASPANIPGRLAAASMLRRHNSDSAVGLLQRLTRDPEPAVGAVALARLIELDPKHAEPDLDFILASPDAKVRRLGVEVLFGRPSESHIRRMGDRMDDAEPEVRQTARVRLHELAAKDEWRPHVLSQGMRLLAASGWGGQEQAAILLAQLDHKPAAPRLVELLTAERPEAFLTAAWALRKLAVPETYPAVTGYVDAEYGRVVGGKPLRGREELPTGWNDIQMSQLNQLLGAQKYAEADRVLRKFIPKRGTHAEARASAIWALGLIHEGKSVPELATAAEGRLNDVASIPPEESRVRRMSAILLARVNAKNAVPSLRTHYSANEPSLDFVNNACGWALERLTGEKYPAPKPIRQVRRDWFLSPLD